MPIQVAYVASAHVLFAKNSPTILSAFGKTFTQHIVNYPELSSVVDTIVYNSYVGELKVNLRLIKTVGLSELGRRVSISGL